MGQLKARVAGLWVATAPPGTVMPPAYAGPRPAAPNDAWFTHSTAGAAGDSGFAVRSGLVWVQLKDTDTFGIYTATAGAIANFTKDYADIAGFTWRWQDPHHFAFRTMRMSGLAPTLSNYTMLASPNGADLIFSGGSTVSLRIANNEMLGMSSNDVSVRTSLSVGGHVDAYYDPLSYTWGNAHFLAYSQAASSTQSLIGLHSPGVAPMLRSIGTAGERIAVVNLTSSAFAPIAASGFEVGSSLAIKRGVRSLRERDQPSVVHDVAADVAPEPDVMSLRPVAFRPKTPPQRIVPTKGDYSTVVPDDPDTWSNEPDIGIIGAEGTRERLGLIAEEVQTVIPSAVNHDRDGNALGIDYAQITVALLDHVQELTRTIETLRYRITELEKAT